MWALKSDSAPPRGSAWKPALEQGERRDAKRESLADRTHERLWEWRWYQRCPAGLWYRKTLAQHYYLEEQKV
jgi:hypothetical protein